MKKHLLFTLSFGILLGLTSCNSVNLDDKFGISVENAKMAVGESQIINLDFDAGKTLKNREVTFEVTAGDDNVSVTNGMIHGLRAGDATISAYILVGDDRFDAINTINVHVIIERPSEVTIISDYSAEEIFVGQTFNVRATVAPLNLANQKVIWDSNEFATITSDGVVTTVAPGDLEITARSYDNDLIIGEYSLRVREKNWTASERAYFANIYGEENIPPFFDLLGYQFDPNAPDGAVAFVIFDDIVKAFDAGNVYYQKVLSLGDYDLKRSGTNLDQAIFDYYFTREISTSLDFGLLMQVMALSQTQIALVLYFVPFPFYEVTNAWAPATENSFNQYLRTTIPYADGLNVYSQLTDSSAEAVVITQKYPSVNDISVPYLTKLLDAGFEILVETLTDSQNNQTATTFYKDMPNNYVVTINVVSTEGLIDGEKAYMLVITAARSYNAWDENILSTALGVDLPYILPDFASRKMSNIFDSTMETGKITINAYGSIDIAEFLQYVDDFPVASNGILPDEWNTSVPNSYYGFIVSELKDFGPSPFNRAEVVFQHNPVYRAVTITITFR